MIPYEIRSVSQSLARPRAYWVMAVDMKISGDCRFVYRYWFEFWAIRSHRNGLPQRINNLEMKPWTSPSPEFFTSRMINGIESKYAAIVTRLLQLLQRLVIVTLKINYGLSALGPNARPGYCVCDLLSSTLNRSGRGITRAFLAQNRVLRT